MGEPLFADLNECAEADILTLLRRNEQFTPVLAQKFVNVRSLVNARPDVSTGLDADNANSVPPFVTANIKCKTFVAFVVKMTQCAGRDEMCDCAPVLDCPVAMARAEGVAAVRRTFQFDDVRVRTFGSVSHVL